MRMENKSKLIERYINELNNKLSLYRSCENRSSRAICEGYLFDVIWEIKSAFETTLPQINKAVLFNSGTAMRDALGLKGILELYLIDVKEESIVKFENKQINKSNKKVFIVHGHDELSKTETARFVEKLGLNAIILHEQLNEGKTIIEKIEANTDVGYAIVLYTYCDDGRDRFKDVNNKRARQNVVFEHGYLIGKLGRKKVCALVKGEIETPGDISGIVYEQMDQLGAWKTNLAKELKAIGLDVDMNNL